MLSLIRTRNPGVEVHILDCGIQNPLQRRTHQCGYAKDPLSLVSGFSQITAAPESPVAMIGLSIECISHTLTSREVPKA